MGWKAVKNHYRIRHIVQVTDKGICIGSGYIGDLIVVGPQGNVVKRYDERSNEDLLRYQTEMDADPAKLEELVRQEDTFATSIPVFTFDGADIIEKRCEALGWPNVTHDGELMYDNMFFADREQAVVVAKANATSRVRSLSREIQNTEEKLTSLKAMMHAAEANLARLEAEHPNDAASVAGIGPTD